MTNVQEALKACEKLFNEALPKFNWGNSTLDANAIKLLNETPALVKAALAEIDKCEPVYQYREIGEGNWIDCKKEWFDYCSKQPEMDTRILYTSPQPRDWDK